MTGTDFFSQYCLQEYFASAMHEYSGLREVIIQINSTSTQGSLFMFELRMCCFLVQEGRRTEKRGLILCYLLQYWWKERLYENLFLLLVKKGEPEKAGEGKLMLLL